MPSREPETDDPASSGRRGGDEYPLLFKGPSRPSRPGLVARMLARILAFFREPPGDAGAATPPPPAPEGTAAHGLLLGEGAEDSPDGRTDQPAPLGRPRRGRSSGYPEGKHEGHEDEDPQSDENGDEEDDGDEDEAGDQEDYGHEVEARDEEDDGDGVEASHEEDDGDGVEARDEDDDGHEYEARDEDEGAEGEPPAPTPIHRATLQMLPGRLVPVKNDVGRQEIRFMRPSKPEQEVTIGWERGAPPDHVTIDHPSVQMRHAGMKYRRGQWWIRSLSDDPPVLLNGRPIGPEGGPRHLKDGDLVRLGDLDFRFRMP